MNIIDENIIENQCQLLRSWRIKFSQIGYGVGHKGLKDKEIISLLHSLHRPTFFSRDDDFYNRNLCHAGYCLVYLAVKKDEAAVFVRRLFRHKEFDTIYKRLGTIIRVTHSGITFWRLNEEKQFRIGWTN
jgi:hypothetical protein